MDWLRQQAQHLPRDNHWEAEATGGLINQLFGCQAALTGRILTDTKAKTSAKADSLTQKWLDKHQDQFEQICALMGSLRRAGTIELSMLVIAEQRLRNMAEL